MAWGDGTGLGFGEGEEQGPRDLGQRLTQAGQAEGLGKVVVVKADQADVGTGLQSLVAHCLVGGQRQGVRSAHDGPSGADPLDQGLNGRGGLGHVLG